MSQTREYHVGDFVVLKSNHGGWNVVELLRVVLNEPPYVVMGSGMAGIDAVQYAERLRKLVCGKG